MSSRRGKRNNERGAEFEREVVDFLHKRQLDARRTGGSGSMNGYQADIEVSVFFQDDPLNLECKRQKGGFKFLYDNLGDNDALVIRADRKHALVVIDLETYADLIQ